MLSRRRFALSLAAGALPLRLVATRRPHIVVVGAGAGGLGFVAQLLARVPADAVEISLVEPRPHYSPPFGTPRVLAGTVALRDLARPYPTDLPLNWRHAAVSALDLAAQTLSLSDRRQLGFDYLILAPGLQAAETLPGAEHLAWFNDDGIAQLLQRLARLPRDARILMTVPHLPYRCPPAPYERAGLILDHLQRAGREDVFVSVLDAKERFSLQAHVLSFWESRWPGRIEWLPPSVHDGLRSWHPDRVDTGLDSFHADLLLAIPAQRAPDFCAAAGLSDFTGFCPITLPACRSQRHPRVYVVGDAAKAGTMPKSASAALAQAGAAAADLAGRLGHKSTTPELHSRCYSRLDRAHAISSHSVFDPDGQRRRETISPYPLDRTQARAEFIQAEASYRDTLAAMQLAGAPPPATDPDH